MNGLSGEERAGYDIEFSLPSLYCGKPAQPCPHTKSLACEGVSCRWFHAGHRFFYPSHRHDPQEEPRCEFYSVGLGWKEVPLSG